MPSATKLSARSEGEHSPHLPLGLLKFRLRNAVSQQGDADSNLRKAKTSLVLLNQKELRRLEILILLDRGIISNSEAMSILGICRSQIYKLLSIYRIKGSSAIGSKARGRSSNRIFAIPVRRSVLEIIQENYRDYGPTLIAELLLDLHGIKISAETIRQWMLSSGLWIRDRSTRKRLHQPRRRRPGYGDLVQMDGSDHDWFEGRGPRCTAMVMVDDATGKLQELRFFPSEDHEAYFQTTYCYLRTHGRPVRIQTDRHAAVWSPRCSSEFTLALNRLNILHIHAYSPQSKGRVERMNRTLQDRLVKAMRRGRISTIEEANAYAPQYIQDHNKRFARDPAHGADSHRSLEDEERAMSVQVERRVTTQMTFSFAGDPYLIVGSLADRDEIGPKVTIEIRVNGTMAVFGRRGKLDVRRV